MKNLKLRYKVLVIILVWFLVTTPFIIYFNYTATRGILYDQKKVATRAAVDLAYKIIENSFNQQKAGFITEKEAQKNAMEEIESLRYGPEEKDYFWINNFAPVMIMHPYTKNLEGEDLSGYKDPTGKKLFVEMVEVVTQDGAGFVDYYWQWKDDATRIEPKLSYVKGFTPWKWIVGSGIYINDVDRLAHTNALVILVVTVITMILACFALMFFTNRLIIDPLVKVTDSAKGVAAGVFTDVEGVESTDEIGELAASFNRMLTTLKKLARQAEAIANDDLHNTLLNEKVEGDLGSAFSTMVAKLGELAEISELISRDEIFHDKIQTFISKRLDNNEKMTSEGVLTTSFMNMLSILRKLTGQAKLIANDDLHNPKLDRMISTGDLGSAFGRMRDKLRQFADQGDRIAQGDLRRRTTDSYEEDGVLSGVFSSMLANLTTLISEIQDVSRKVKKTAAEIMGAAEEMMQSTQTQTEKITDTSAAITEMSASIQQISASSKKADLMASQAQEAAAGGAFAVKDTINGLNTITDTIQTAGEMTRKLGERSQEIGQITATITEISELTNLLALNAAIEAARAGEHGRGFAVVAAEVRKLAERTAASAKEISGIIEKIQSEITTINKAMEQSSQSAVDGMVLANDLSMSFADIQESVRSTNANMEQIAQAMAQQAEVCDDIVLAIDTITSVVRETENQSDRLLKQVGEMRHITENLDQQTNKFEL